MDCNTLGSLSIGLPLSTLIYNLDRLRSLSSLASPSPHPLWPNSNPSSLHQRPPPVSLITWSVPAGSVAWLWGSRKMRNAEFHVKKINRYEQNSKPRVEHILARRLLQLNSSHTHEARPGPSFSHHHTPVLIPSLVSFYTPFTSPHHSISSHLVYPCKFHLHAVNNSLSLSYNPSHTLHLLPSLVSITLIHPAKCLSFLKILLLIGG